MLQHGNPVIHSMYLNVITAASRPFMLQLNNWIYEGKLLDPHNEFFIQADLRVPVESLWFNRNVLYYLLKVDKVDNLR